MAELKRYNLVLPKDLYSELKAVAEENGSSVLEVIKSFIKVGFVINEINNNPDEKLVIRKNDTEREILFII